jgi:MFS transporter, UMF1 family
VKPPHKWMTASWVLYDLAGTVFSATVTFLFVPHVGAASTGIINSVAMIIAGLGTPLVACLADRTGQAGRYNTLATLLCISAMAMFGVFSSNFFLMAAFFVAIIGYQAALTFYNSLLPSVASERHMGLVSGLGVGLGYLGTVFTLMIALPIQTKLGVRPAYFATAGAFLICALPCMLFVRDRRPIVRENISRSLIKSQWWELVETVRNLPRQPVLMWFLLGNFFAVDVLHTAILFYGRFLKDCFEPMARAGKLVLLGYPIHNISDFLIIGGLAVNIPALVYGLVLGHLADRIGSPKVFVLAIACLAGGLAGAAFFGGWAPMLFLVSICFFGGLGLAGIWTVGRKLLIQLVPRELVARYFGLYGITSKVSVIGSTVCGVMISLYGPRIAILSQVLPLLVSFFCLYKMTRKKV